MAHSDHNAGSISHFVIPDTQVKPGVPVDHLRWIGQYILDIKPDKVIHLGDHWDMESLSSYDRGKKAMEGRRYTADVEAGNRGLKLLTAPLEKANWSKRKRGTEEYRPELHLLRGNHENRITRAIEDDARMEGALSFEHLESPGWEVHEFLDPLTLDGVVYAHYLYNPMTGRPYGGQSIDTRLKTVGHSFTMGHQQGLWYGLRPTIKGNHHGLVAGSCYLHEEDYLGPQTINYWRGVIVCHEVRDGTYDPMFVSLDYLCRRYEGVSLAEFMAGR